MATPPTLVAEAPAAAPVAPVAGEAPVQTAEELAAEDAAAAAEEARLVATETPEQTEARHATEAAALAAAGGGAEGAFEPVEVELPGAHEGEVVRVAFGDQESLEAVNRLKKGYARREQAEQIRDEAQRIRDEAEDIHYAAELDPANILMSSIRSGQDVDHLFRFLATRSGVLDRNREWAAALLDQPDTVASQAAQLDAERINRRDRMRGVVGEKMAFDENARAVLKATSKGLTQLAPESFTDESLALLDRDVKQDMLAAVNGQVRQYMRDNGITQDANGRTSQPIPLAVRMFDARGMEKVIKRRLELLGIQPRKPGAPAGSKDTLPAGGTKTPPVGKTPLTPQALKAARAARRSAASAPPGAGSPVATMPKAPPYDPKQKGTPIQQAAAFGRAMMARLSKRPA